MKGIAGGLHFGKGIQDNGYGQFLSMLGYNLEEEPSDYIEILLAGNLGKEGLTYE